MALVAFRAGISTCLEAAMVVKKNPPGPGCFNIQFSFNVIYVANTSLLCGDKVTNALCTGPRSNPDLSLVESEC